jgi:drug/metabolite transporter (DMT)-like permease
VRSFFIFRPTFPKLALYIMSFITGITLTILSCFFWGIAVILFRLAGDQLSSFGLNMGKNVVGLLFFTLSIPLVSFPLFSTPARDMLMLILSGIIGVGLGDLLFMKALKLLGAGLNTIVASLYTPLLITGSIIFLGESLNLSIILGASFVIIGIIIASMDDLKSKPKHIILGILAGSSAMIFTVTGILLMKDLLTKYSPIYVNWIRISSGTIFLAFGFLFVKDKKTVLRGMNKKRNWKLLFISGFMGTFLAIMSWTIGLSILPASLVAVIGQFTMVVILVLAFFVLKERITFKKVLSATIVTTGILIVTFVN